VAGTHAKLKAELDGPTFEMASSVSRTVLGRGTSVMVRRRSSRLIVGRVFGTYTTPRHVGTSGGGNDVVVEETAVAVAFLPGCGLVVEVRAE